MTRILHRSSSPFEGARIALTQARTERDEARAELEAARAEPPPEPTEG